MNRKPPPPPQGRAPSQPNGSARLIAETEELIALRAYFVATRQYEAAALVGCDLYGVMKRINDALGSRGMCGCCGGAK